MIDISIVIPCYNCVAFLPDALESISKYTGTHSYEVILVNDGSTDEDTNIYLENLKSKINYRVIEQAQAGPAAARNTGIRHARADLILLLDSDNKLYADIFINKGIRFMNEHPDTGVYYGIPAFFGATNALRHFTPMEFDLQNMLVGNYIDMCAIIRKKAWQDVGGLDENRLLIGHEDWDFWLRIGRSPWNFHFEDIVMFEYRVRDDSLVSQAITSADHHAMIRYVYRKHYDLLPPHLKTWCDDKLMVSVIVPNYNHAPYLSQRLDSILQQTYSNFELIILDDHSADNSREIIDSYRAHPKVSRIVYNQQNSGSTFKQWQKGIQLAQGELVWLAESDDWCEISFLETLIKGFNEDESCVLAYTQALALTNDGNILWQSTHNRLFDRIEGKKYIREFLARGNKIFNASMAVFKKDAFFNVQNDYLTYSFSGDWLFWTEIARQGNVYISGKALNYFRNHDAHVSHIAYASGLNYIEDIRVWMTLFKNKLIDEQLYTEVITNKHADFCEVRSKFSESTVEEIIRLFEATGILT